MAGIGVNLKKIFSKNTITTHVYGFSYSEIATIAPMLLVIAAIIIMQMCLGGGISDNLLLTFDNYCGIFPVNFHRRNIV